MLRRGWRRKRLPRAGWDLRRKKQVRNPFLKRCCAKSAVAPAACPASPGYAVGAAHVVTAAARRTRPGRPGRQKRGTAGENPSVWLDARQLPLHSSHRPSSSSCAGVAVGLFYEKSTQYSFLQNTRPSVASRPTKGDNPSVTPRACQLPLHRGAEETAERVPPLCKGRWHSEAVTEGLSLKKHCACEGKPNRWGGFRVFLGERARGRQEERAGAENSIKSAKTLCERQGLRGRRKSDFLRENQE